MSKHFLCPKPRGRARTRFIPSLPEAMQQRLIGDLAPAERKALAQIVETADLIEVEGASPFLLVPTTPKMIEALAAFGAELEDLEIDLHDSDGSPDKEDVECTEDDRDYGDAFEGVPPPGSRKSYEEFTAVKRTARGWPCTAEDVFRAHTATSKWLTESLRGTDLPVRRIVRY